MSKPLLICTVGLPRSGKSTWTKQQRLPIVNRDAVRLALHGQRFLAEAEDMVAAMTKYMAKALFLGGNQTVIVDECNVSEKRRELWLSDKWDTVFQYFDTPVEECERRAIATGQEDLIPVINRMAEGLDWYSMTDEVNDLICDNQEHGTQTTELALPLNRFIQLAWEMEQIEQKPWFTKICAMGEVEYHGVKIKLQEEL
jgi:predicted kinase